jgi:arylsulfatase A-like enzyme
MALPAGVFSCRSSASPPNFVFFLIDDMGWMDTGCYGSSFYETPHIDRLAREGMRFTDAYAACPVCSPTRASIFTGKYPARLGLTDYLVGRRKGKLLPAEFIHQMPLEEVTLAEALQEAGYTSFFAGKWHLGKEPFYPGNQGFDINRGGGHHGHPYHGYYSPYQLDNLEEGPEGEYLTDRLTEEAVEFLKKHGQTPFLLFLSHYAVHTPLQAPDGMVTDYRQKADKLPLSQGPRFKPEGEREARQVQDHPVYAAMVESVDRSVGRILDMLEELGQKENTVVLFFSDNGGLSTSEGSPTANVPLRAGKGWLYEGGIREPLIIKWPGVTRPGSVCVQPVISTDFYPTLLEMANQPLRPGQHMDGISFVPLLREEEPGQERALFWHYPHYSNQGGKPGGAVRQGDYKLIEFYEDFHVELYDLNRDVGEHTDLASRMPGIRDRLRNRLHQWRKRVNARMPREPET